MCAEGCQDGVWVGEVYPRCGQLKGCTVCRKFLKIMKLIKTQPAFYYHQALAILKNISDKTAPARVDGSHPHPTPCAIPLLSHSVSATDILILSGLFSIEEGMLPQNPSSTHDSKQPRSELASELIPGTPGFLDQTPCSRSVPQAVR